MDSFAQILAEKMQNTPKSREKTAPLPQEKEPYFEPRPPIFTGKRYHWPQTNTGKRVYRSRHTPIARKKVKPKVSEPVENTWCFEELNKKQKQDLQCLRTLGAEFSQQKFSLNTLRSEYHRLLKVWHPDLGQSGCTDELMQLLKAYRSLKSSLEAKPTPNL